MSEIASARELSGPDAQERRAAAEAFAERAREAGVRLVACTVIDSSGVNRVKVVPLERLPATAVDGVGMSRGTLLYTVHDECVLSTGVDAYVGDVRLVPDVATARILPGMEGWALCCADQRALDGSPLLGCGRTLLRLVTADALALGLRPRMAYEVEFTLLDDDGAPAHRGPGYGSRPLLEQPVLLELLDALELLGVPAHQLHVEYGAGQYEVSVGADDPLAAVDSYVAIRWLVAALARRRELHATFAPLSALGRVGNGAHLHLSAERDGRNVMSGDGTEAVGAEGRAMIAGILDTLPELMAVYAPSVPSYWRLEGGMWSGAAACWGVQNREAALRMIASDGPSANVELKLIDGAANPYVAAAAMLSSALAGVRDGLEPPPSVEVDPARLGASERSGAVRELPASLGDAIAQAREGTALARALGEDYARVFLAIRQREWEVDGGRDRAEVVRDNLWRYG